MNKFDQTDRQFVWALMAALLFLILCYLPGLPEGRLIYDDTDLMRAPQILAPFNWAWLKAIFTPGNHIDYYPLRDLSYWLDQKFLGENAYLWFRVENFLWFAVTIFGFFRLLRAVGLRADLAFGIAGIWFLHPIHSEALMWLSARKDVMGLCFGIWAVYFYLRYEQNQSRGVYVASVLCFAASLLAKASISLLPIAAAPAFLYGLRRGQWRRLLWLLPFLFLGALSCVVQNFLYTKVNDMRFYYEAWYRILGSFAALGRTCLGLILPFLNVVDLENWGTWAVRNRYFGLVGILVWIGLAVWLLDAARKKNQRALIGIFAILALYLPISALLFPHRNFYSVRYMEGPFLALWLAGAALAFKWNPDRRKVKWAFGILLGAVLLGTEVESHNWEDSFAVLQKTLRYDPDNLSIRSVLLQNYINLANSKPPDVELLANIKRRRADMNIFCQPDQIKITPNGHDCMNYLRYLFGNYNQFRNGSAYAKLMWVTKQIILQVNPTGALRHDADLRAAAVLEGHLNAASAGDVFAEVVRRFPFLDRSSLRFIGLAHSCLSHRPDQARKDLRTYLHSGLLDSLDLGIRVHSIADRGLRQKISECLGAQRLVKAAR